MKKYLARAEICHLTSVHDPLDTRIYRKECLSLVRYGYRVCLIAPSATGGDVQDVVQLVSLPPVNSRLARMLFQPWRVLFAAIRSRARAYHFHDPELLVVGMLLKLTGSKVIYDVHESVGADILSKSYLPTWFRRLAALAVSALERVGTRLYDGIISATPFIASSFAPVQSLVVQNFPINGELAVSEELEVRQDLALYMGSMSDIRGITEMVQAMSLLSSRDSTKLVLVGRFSDQSFENLLRGMPGWARVEYHPWQDRKSLARMMSRCRVGLILLHPAPNHYHAYPNKLFEYMSAGLPVLASDFPLWREIIEGSGCGQVVDPTKPGEIAKRIAWFIGHPLQAEEMGKKGKAAVANLYNWDREEGKLIAFYQNLIGPPEKKSGLAVNPGETPR
jgi:glycosyltransferase involved in cell wall biosynthesis